MANVDPKKLKAAQAIVKAAEKESNAKKDAEIKAAKAVLKKHGVIK